MAMADRFYPTSEIALHAADRHDHAMQHRKNGKNQNKIYYVTQIKWEKLKYVYINLYK